MLKKAFYAVVIVCMGLGFMSWAATIVANMYM
jgi:hypothetical protein